MPPAGFPHLPDATDAPDVFTTGHLWVEEYLDGDPLRFGPTDAGYLAFADPTDPLDHDAIPCRYRAAVRAVRENFAHDTLGAVADPTTVTVLGVATHARGTGYDLDVLPPFVVTAIHDAARGRYLGPDAARQAATRMGLPTIEPLDRELRARDVDPDTYPIPDSHWRDGPAVGVVFHNKAGGRAVRFADDSVGGAERVGGDEPSTGLGVAGEHDDERDAAASLIGEHVDDAWIDARRVAVLGSGEGAVDGDGAVDGGGAVDGDGAVDGGGAVDGDTAVDDVVDRGLERLARETNAVGGDEALPEAAVRSALADRVSRYLGQGG